MADNEKTYSEQEHLAILADRVTTETADKTSRITELETENAELKNKLDVAESAKESAVQRAETAEQAHEAFKTEIAEREAAEARKDERLAAAKEAASHLDDSFFEDADRVKRIVAMKDEDFATYVADLKDTAKGLPPKGTSTPPRETAMSGAGAGAPAAGTANARSVLLGRFPGASQEG